MKGVGTGDNSEPGATYLELDDLLQMLPVLGIGPVRDIGLLDSAVLRCQATVFGEDAYPSLAEKAAALLHSIANNHAPVDGNKRLSWQATVTFLDQNLSESRLSPEQAIKLTLDVATGEMDVSEIADRLHVAFLPWEES